MIRMIILALGLAATIHTETTAQVSTTKDDIVAEIVFEEVTTIETPTTSGSFANDTSYTTDVPRKVRSEGGSEVSSRRYKKYYSYIVAIFNAFGGYSCVGTIITPRLILTAHHCLEGAAWIRAQSRDIYYGGSVHYISQAIMHPNGGLNTNDIGLIVLQTRIKNARPVTLLDPEIIVPNGSKVRALGWGLSKSGHPRFLMMVKLRVTSVSECLEEYRGIQWICTKSSWKTFTCYGDSGGPILYEGEQVGIVSHSSVSYCGSGVPTANVNVKKYFNWIKSHAEEYD